jgi:transcription-repair coupling factor (superfamily II helicase)
MTISGLNRVHKAHLICAICENYSHGDSLLVLVETENEAMRLCDDINTLSGFGAVVCPAKDFNPIWAAAASREYEYRRISVMTDAPKVILSTPQAASQTTFSPKKLAESIINIQKDDELNLERLFCDLIKMGYTRVDMVESLSQFSVRGSVIDVYAVNNSAPMRIDLWGDTVDSISLFDAESQRSIKNIDKIFIAPANEESGDSTLFDYVRHVVICERTKCNEQFRAAHEQLLADLELNPGYKDKFMLERFEYEGIVKGKLFADLSTFARSGGVDVSMNAGMVPGWNADYSQLKSDLKGYIKGGYAMVIFAGTVKAAKSLALDLRDDGFPADYTKVAGEVHPKHILVTHGTLSSGFDYPREKLVCVTAAVTGGGRVFGETSRPAKKAKKKNKAQAIRALSEINVGDYIVHDSYGIGIFEGVTKLTNDGVSKDYIKLRYAGKDALYVPVTQLDFIARYIGNTETASLKLSKLHTDTWFNTKRRVKKAVEELARELIELYSKRMRSKGVAFSKDTPEQVEFESKFSYIETRDQLTCIDELKSDMHSKQPMDRLLCGDVGFGKTEVALRGAFKCVMQGYQCALLCPTTVLAWQHYQTALMRMEGFPVNIELLSRFRTAKEQREVLRNLEAGIVDFVIGTHVLVGKDVRFKNLGLVIIDEEQRFGVMQKERLKQVFGAGGICEDGSESGVDVLTLSATPIPRTLNMAMSGIRDMSVIETPPHDRMPVTTYVIEHDAGVVTAAIHKELRRAGQVYYIHNRVETIVSCAARLQESLPQARIGIAHGRMDERGLLDVWRRLLEREIDVLVCTTLIETGVDVPNVNTLIIENADKMGLAQLHQLRGRVGRTNRRAYAYFTFAREKVLTEIAQKRLKAVREFTQFGAGFKIALRDLEIRGAGSVLGESQSGHLSAVGYETYVRLLEQAVDELQNPAEPSCENQETVTTPAGTVVDIKADAFIPEDYICNQSQRIACYKRIAEIRDEDGALDVVEELTDRYGAVPKPVKGLVDAARLRNMAAGLGISEVVQKKEVGAEVLLFYWQNPDMQRISRVSDEFSGRVALNLIGRTGLSLRLDKNDDVLAVAAGFLKSLDN